MKALIDEGGYPQDIYIAASRTVRNDPAVPLFQGKGGR